jgi:hypothetical protein
MKMIDKCDKHCAIIILGYLLPLRISASCQLFALKASEPNVLVMPSHSPATIAFSDRFTLLIAVNQIGAAGAAAVASALEPRRNGDGSWTPSTALTALGLAGEWALILVAVT